MSQLAPFVEDFARLLEASFVAAQQFDEDSANKLLAAAQLLDPTSTAPKIGMASLCLHKLEVRRSIKILEEVLEQEPDNYRASALLGISYLLANQDVEKGQKLLSETLKKCDDAPTKRLCELWMQVLEKGGSPASPQQTPEKKEKK